MNTFNSSNLRFDKLLKYAFEIIDYFQLMVLAIKNEYVRKVKSRPISLIVHKISVQIGSENLIYSKKQHNF